MVQHSSDYGSFNNKWGQSMESLVTKYRHKTVYGAVACLDDNENAIKYANSLGLFVINSPYATRS